MGKGLFVGTGTKQAIESAEQRIKNILEVSEKPVQGIILEGKPTVKIAFIKLDG